MNILEEAQRVVADRERVYGKSQDCLGRHAGMLAGAGYGRMLDGVFYPMHTTDVSIFFILGKISRELNLHKRDNLVDIAGFTYCLEKVTEPQESGIANATQNS